MEFSSTLFSTTFEEIDHKLLGILRQNVMPFLSVCSSISSLLIALINPLLVQPNGRKIDLY